MKDDSTHEHIVNYGTYILVWLALLALTALTVTIAGLNLGNLTVVVALVIAMIKSILVVNVFMHIKFDQIMFKIFVLVGILTLLAIFILTFSDYLFR